MHLRFILINMLVLYFLGRPNMNGRERMLTALRRGTPDKVPLWELIINEPVIKAICPECSYPDFVELVDMDGATAGEDLRLEEISPGRFKCEWGILWEKTKDGILYPLKGPLKDRKDILEYQPPDPDAPHRLETLNSLVDRFKGEKCIVFLGHDSFEFSHYLLGGMGQLFRLYRRDPEAAHILAEKIAEYKARVMERAVKEGADVLLSGDDYADKTAPFMSPKLFRKFVYPYLKRVVDVAKRLNVPFIKHTDGNIWKIMDLLIEAGIDALHPLEPAAGMDISEVKAKYGDKIALIGNIDCTIVLPLGSPSDVEEVVKETLAKAAPGGGYILSSSNSIHPGVKPENFLAMVRTARKYGVYPLEESFVEKYSKLNYYEKIFSRQKA